MSSWREPRPGGGGSIPGRGAQAGLPEAQSGAHQRCAAGGQGLGSCELRMVPPEFAVGSPQDDGRGADSCRDSAGIRQASHLRRKDLRGE